METKGEVCREDWELGECGGQIPLLNGGSQDRSH